MNLATACYGIHQVFWLSRQQPAASLPAEMVMEINTANLNRDVELLRRISQGDRKAFAEFYDLYSPLLYSVAIKILNDPKEAEDVLQDVFFQIWEKAGLFDPKLGKPSSWAITFIRNKSIDRIRASQRRARLLENALDETAPASVAFTCANEIVHGREKAKLIQGAITGLPPEQRQAIELAFFSGLTQNEISDQLRQPLGTIKARIRRGLFKLRERLEGNL